MLYCLDCVKKSAKGVSRFTQQQLLHNMYKECLLSGQTVRKSITRITSQSHNLITITTNKVCLNSFDNKRYVCDGKIDTLPFGHNCIDWESLSDWSFESDNVASLVNNPEWTEDMHLEGGYNVDIFTPPDPGFNQREYSQTELQNVADLEAETDSNSTPTPNPFLDLEAIESPDEGLPRSKKPRAKLIESDSE